MTRLPTDTTQRALALVERSRPASSRPRLSDPDLEAKMTSFETEKAMRYARKEDLCDQLERVTADLDSSDGIVIEIDEESSVVTHVDELENAVTKPR